MKNIGCTIIEDFQRPPAELIESFRGIPVANIDDCMNRTAAISGEIYPINAAPLLGPALTVRVTPGDNLMFHKAMDLAKPGDVIVIDAGGLVERATLGELMALYCKTKGVAGIIVDGAIRDVDELSEMDMPIYARGVSPNGPYKNGPGEINLPVCIGGRVVCPGDILAGDGDGVIVIKQEEAAGLAEKAKSITAAEEGIRKEILEKGTMTRPWLDEKLTSLKCEIRKA